MYRYNSCLKVIGHHQMPSIYSSDDLAAFISFNCHLPSVIRIISRRCNSSSSSDNWIQYRPPGRLWPPAESVGVAPSLHCAYRAPTLFWPLILGAWTVTTARGLFASDLRTYNTLEERKMICARAQSLTHAHARQIKTCEQCRARGEKDDLCGPRNTTDLGILFL